MQGRRPINDVRKVKVHYVVASDNVGVDLDEEVSPGLEELLLVAETVYLRADYGGAGTQSEHVADQGLGVPVDLHYISYLDNWVRLCLRELSLLGGALDIK